MSNLLTPSESHAFQSFLSAMDHPDNEIRHDSSEWSSYNGQSQHYAPDIPPVQQGREALAKATKDLMSLDAEGWNSASMMQQYQQQQYANFMPQQPSQNGYDMHNHPQSAPNLIHQQQQQSHRNVSFPFLLKSGPQPALTHSQSSPPHTLHTQAHVPQPASISPLHTMSGAQDPRSGSNIHSFNNNMGSSRTTSSSTTSTFSFGSNGNMHGSSSTSTLPSPPPSVSQRASPGASSGKRGSDYASPCFPNKRSRPSPPSTSASLPNKAALLSPSQKKANHIQSEQKRRANIRKGYEALCETVPALREAIRLEEEAQHSRETGKAGKAKRGRRGKVDETTGEKIDGRAGPRSENIVLSKTIDYINDLLKDRQDLLTRLERARSVLGPNHPSCTPADGTSLWEREWKGGSGKDGDVEEDEDDEEED